MPKSTSRKASSELFPTDEPLDARHMIGRDEDIDEVAGALRGGGSVILAAPRRVGKTTVCDVVLEKLRKEGLYVVSVDLFEIADAAELAETLISKTLANRPALKQLISRARKLGRDALGAIAVQTVLKTEDELGVPMEIVFSPGVARSDPDKYLTAALELPNKIAAADGRRLVVFFDEFQEIASPTAPYGSTDALTKRMRAVFQRSKNVSFLFAGSIQHLMRDLFAPGNRAFSRFGKFHSLREIDADTWRVGLRARLRQDGCTIDAAALERLVELGELHPRATMLIAQQAHLASVFLDERSITAALVTQGYLEAVKGDRLYHQQAVESIRSMQKDAFSMVRRVALGTRPLYGSLAPQAAKRALDALERAGFVERRGRGEWRIVDPLFKRYLLDLEARA